MAGIGKLTEITVTQPAAGAEWSYTFTGWTRILTAYVLFTCSASAGNRNPGYWIKDPAGNKVWQLTATANLAATNAVSINYVKASLAGSPVTGGTGTEWVLNLPVTAVLPTGWQISSQTTGILSGDQYGSVLILAQTWDIDPTSDFTPLSI